MCYNVKKVVLVLVGVVAFLSVVGLFVEEISAHETWVDARNEIDSILSEIRKIENEMEELEKEIEDLESTISRVKKDFNDSELEEEVGPKYAKLCKQYAKGLLKTLKKEKKDLEKNLPKEKAKLEKKKGKLIKKLEGIDPKYLNLYWQNFLIALMAEFRPKILRKSIWAKDDKRGGNKVKINWRKFIKKAEVHVKAAKAIKKLIGKIKQDIKGIVKAYAKKKKLKEITKFEAGGVK